MKRRKKHSPTFPIFISSSSRNRQTEETATARRVSRRSSVEGWERETTFVVEIYGRSACAHFHDSTSQHCSFSVVLFELSLLSIVDCLNAPINRTSNWITFFNHCKCTQHETTVNEPWMISRRKAVRATRRKSCTFIHWLRWESERSNVNKQNRQHKLDNECRRWNHLWSHVNCAHTTRSTLSLLRQIVDIKSNVYCFLSSYIRSQVIVVFIDSNKVPLVELKRHEIHWLKMYFMSYLGYEINNLFRAHCNFLSSFSISIPTWSKRWKLKRSRW